MDELAALCRDARGQALRVMIDGADAAEPELLAVALAQRLRADGRPCATVQLADWLRPASLRLEHGHQDAQSYRANWFDYAALRREVLDPLGPGGQRRWLPTLWNARTDRATRAAHEHAPEDMVLLVAGPMLLGRGLPFELTVHLHLSAAALRRRTPAELGWTVDALVAHEDAVHSDAVADVVVRADHPDRPAIRARFGTAARGRPEVGSARTP